MLTECLHFSRYSNLFALLKNLDGGKPLTVCYLISLGNRRTVSAPHSNGLRAIVMSCVPSPSDHALVDIQDTYGALFLGVVVSVAWVFLVIFPLSHSCKFCSFLGIATVQGWIFWLNYPDDILRTKVTVRYRSVRIHRRWPYEMSQVLVVWYGVCYQNISQFQLTERRTQDSWVHSVLFRSPCCVPLCCHSMGKPGCVIEIYMVRVMCFLPSQTLQLIWMFTSRSRDVRPTVDLLAEHFCWLGYIIPG